MERRLSSYIGCLLGLAAGDGAGEPLENGFRPTSAYTQMAAYACNGLLLGLTRGQLCGTMAPPVHYVEQALREWGDIQLWIPGRRQCWLSRASGMDYRRCREPEIMDVLKQGDLGTMEDHAFALDGPGGLMAAVAVGMFYDAERIRRRELQRLGAEAAALTHGDTGAFLSGAALANILSRILWDGETDLDRITARTGAMLRLRFGREYHRAGAVAKKLTLARRLAKSGKTSPAAALEKLGSETAPEVLAAAVYCCMRREAEPEGAVACVAGAILGAIRGEEAFSRETVGELRCADTLRELAEDMYRGCPVTAGSGVFDVEWDEKYGG